MNLTSKDILAKLLATENVTVTHRNAKTASFNVRDRVLTLPMWDNMETCTYDHLVGHEVGHALYTPEDGWHEAVCSKGQAYKSFLNVVEDARIEKMIQARYPGLRRSFVSSYKKMLSEGFFGGDIDLINTYDLIDRINTYFKVGRSAGVRIEKTELPWIREIESLQTWEDVVELTDRLFEFCKSAKQDEMEQFEEFASSAENQAPEKDGDDDEGYDDFDRDGDETEESESDETGVDEADQEAASDEATDYEENDISSPYGNYQHDTLPEEEVREEEDPLVSKTDKTLRRSISSEHGEDTGIHYSNIKLNTSSLSDIIIDHKEIMRDIMFTEVPGVTSEYSSEFIQAKENAKGLLYGEGKYKKFLANNKNTINYMVKEFEMRKSAAAYSRQTLSKTGVIDPVKMNSYLYSDDIFRKVSTTLDGKNHGMLMYMDWSGSMGRDLKATIDQLLNLVLFCKQVNIPYRVYAFTDRFGDHQSQSAVSWPSTPINTIAYTPGFRLLEMFNSNMNRREFTQMAGLWLSISSYYSSTVRSWIPPGKLQLGGTPLEDCIIAAFKVHDDFKANTKVDIINTIFLTDGESHPTFCKADDNRHYLQRISHYFDYQGHRTVLYMVDPVTNTRYKVTGYKSNTTSTLLKMYRERTKSNTVGYRIMSPNWSTFKGQLPQTVNWSIGTGLCKQMRDEKFVVLPSVLGYDKCFAIAGGRYLETSNGAIEVESDASKGRIRTAFKKANSSRKGSRKMLSDLIATIS